MAEQVTTQLANAAVHPPVGGTLQRKCACGNHTVAEAECESCKKEVAGRNTLQRAAVHPSEVDEVPPIVHDVLRSPGEPLDAATRNFMEPRFGHDFSRVRVHTDAHAAESARAVNALAYTVGRDVVFGKGQYEPSTSAGQQLVAHELTHVMQQSSPTGARAGVALQRQEASNQQPTAGSDGGWSKLIPAFAAEKALAPPIHLPPLDAGAFIAKPTISLVGSLTYGPANSVVTISAGDFSSAMGGLANSFSVAFVKDTGGKVAGVTFTSKLPGFDKYNSTTYSYKPPLTAIWSSVFTPPPYAFKGLKVEGTIRVQLEVVLTPKIPSHKYSPVTSPKPVVDLRPAAVFLGFLTLLGRIGMSLGRAVVAPIIMLDPELTDPHYHKGNKIRAKLVVSEAGDPYEQEADQVAEKISQMGRPAPTPETANGELKQIQRACQESDGHGRTASSAGTRIEAIGGSGEPLPAASRAFFEPRFGHDFSRVRVHTDSRAAASASEMHAHAYTLGHDIVFASGQYAPEAFAGKKLLAHELTHVVQQETETALETDLSPASLRTRGPLVQRSNAADTRLPNDEPEAIAFATAAEAAIVAANGRLATAAEPERRNVPSFVAQQGIKLQALTPRHDNTVGLSPFNFFAGQVDYSDTVTLAAETTHHVSTDRTSARIRAREHANIDNLLPPDEIERRLVQAVSEIAFTAASRMGAPNTFELYRAQFNSFWNAPPFNALPATFDPALPSKGPRNTRARAIFDRIYQDDPNLRDAYNGNTAGIREKIDTYSGPEGLNPVNSPRIQTLRAAFFPFAAPISSANYPAFLAAISAASAALEDSDRRAVELSNDWQQLINRHLTAETKRQEIRAIIATPPPAPARPAVAPPPVIAPPPAPGGGGGAVTPQQFVDSISIDGPVAPIQGNNRLEPVTLTPLSTLPNPNVAIDTQLTVTPQPQVQGPNISPVSPWPNGAAAGIPFQPDIINNGAANMTAHLDLLNRPVGLAPAVAIPDLPFQVQDNRQANVIANWFTDVLVNTGANSDWQGNIINAGGAVHYRGGTQNFRVGAFLPSPNPGLTLFVAVRLKRGAAVIAAPAALAPFPADVAQIVPIPININAPAAVPIAGDNLTFEIDLIAADRVTVLSSKPVAMTVMPEQVYTKAQATAAATLDEAHLNDPSAAGLLGKMTAQGGLAARVSAAIQVAPPLPRIKLRAMTVRHDSRAYVASVLSGPHPEQVGYFVGTTYNDVAPDATHSFAGVTGAAAMFFPSGFGPRFVAANRTTDVFTNAQRPDADLITFIVHEAVHAMDVRPGAGTEIEYYKTEFRAYWMDGRFGPPSQAICPPPLAPFNGPCPPVGAACYDATYIPELAPPGPKSCRARAIFSQQLYGSETYPNVKPAYDNNRAGFRVAVDNYLIPDGINLISSVRLEVLRKLIAGGPVGGFAAFRDKVRAFRGLGPGPVPPAGVLDADEENEINRNRAWRDLVNSKLGVVAQRDLIKADLNIPL